MSKKKTTNKFILEANIIHDNKYNYSKVIYSGNKRKVQIVCPKHGEFSQTASDHLKYGCYECGRASTTKKRTYTTEQFIEKSKEKHGHKYDYTKSVYLKGNIKIKIICKIHGEFWQNPVKHMFGRGCPKCKCAAISKARFLTPSGFIKRSSKIHNNKYDYSKSVYTSAHEKIKIICPVHGEFWQKSDDHMNGHGCSTCGRTTSQIELSWLNFLEIPNKFRNKSIRINGRLFRPDAIDEINKICWEFLGDFWHGNINKYSPKEINRVTKTTFQELHDKTFARLKILEENGYKVIYIWESDFKKEVIGA